MKKIGQYIFVVALLFVFSSLAVAQTVHLFKIERSKNANIVQYDVNIDEDGQINKKNPIDYYWLLYAEQGQREEISTLQKKAYGYSIKYNESGYFDMQMKAVEGRKIRLLLVNGVPKAEITINGKTTYLTKVYINSKDNFVGYPTVIYYTLTGNDIETGEEIVEKIEV